MDSSEQDEPVSHRMTAQESLSELERQWTAAVLSTAPADRAAVEAAVVGIYQLLELDPPRRLAWADGPIELVRRREQCWPDEDIGDNVLPTINDKLAHTNGTFSGAVRSHPLYWRRHALLDVYGSLWHTIGMLADQDAARPRTRSWRRLVAWLTGEPRPPTLRTLGTGSRSQFDALYLCTQSHLYSQFGLLPQSAALLQGLVRLVTSVGWFVPHRNMCWLCDRPEILKVDARGRLHAAGGPALRYRDGWEVHFWKGVRIPSALSEQPDTICVGRIDRERDPMVRRCMIELMTPASYIALGGARVVSRDETGVLWQKDWALDTWAAVEVTNGTPEPDGSYKRYVLQVPPEMRTPRQAVAWTYGLSEPEYSHLTIRT